MERLFDDPAFWEKERELQARDPEKYDAPKDEENYSFCVPIDDPAVKAAKRATNRRRTRIRKRLKDDKRCELVSL